MFGRLLYALTAAVLAVGFCVLYFAGTNWLLNRIVGDRRRSDGTMLRRDGIRTAVRPWLFTGPALLLLSVYLVYPVYETIKLSFLDKAGVDFVGLSNYLWAFTNPEFLQAIRNNLLWLVMVPTMSCIVGLIVAVLADRVWWGTIAKSLIFMPMAISVTMLLVAMAEPQPNVLNLMSLMMSSSTLMYISIRSPQTGLPTLP